MSAISSYNGAPGKLLSGRGCVLYPDVIKAMLTECSIISPASTTNFSQTSGLLPKDLRDMCTVTLRQSAIFTIACMVMNGYNLAYVLVPEVKRFLLSQPWFEYVPDVHNVTVLVGPEWSKNILLGLAGGSVFFDVVMFFACCIKSPNLLDSARLWHYLDLCADVMVGLASANYTRPNVVIFVKGAKHTPTAKPASQSPLAQPVVCTDGTQCSGVAAAPNTVQSGEAEARSANVWNSSSSAEKQDDVGFASKQMTVPGGSQEGALQSQQQPEDIPILAKVNPYKALLKPPTVRQLLHFIYVPVRAWMKFEMLWMYGIFVHHYKNV